MKIVQTLVLKCPNRHPWKTRKTRKVLKVYLWTKSKNKSCACSYLELVHEDGGSRVILCDRHILSYVLVAEQLSPAPVSVHDEESWRVLFVMNHALCLHRLLLPTVLLSLLILQAQDISGGRQTDVGVPGVLDGELVPFVVDGLHDRLGKVPEEVAHVEVGVVHLQVVVGARGVDRRAVCLSLKTSQQGMC